MATAKKLTNLERIRLENGVTTTGEPYQLTEDIVIQPVSGEVLARARDLDVENLEFRDMLELLLGKEATDVILAEPPNVTVAILEEVFATTGIGAVIGVDKLTSK